MAVRRIDCECSSAVHVRQGSRIKTNAVSCTCFSAVAVLGSHSPSWERLFSLGRLAVARLMPSAVLLHHNRSRVVAAPRHLPKGPPAGRQVLHRLWSALLEFMKFVFASGASK